VGWAQSEPPDVSGAIPHTNSGTEGYHIHSYLNAGVQSLSVRRSELGRRFFRSVTVSDSCLHDLFPQRRDSEILSRFRWHTVYPIPRTKTNKYRSFIHYALAKYQ